MAVLFSDQELKIYDYNRVVMDLNGISDDEFIEKLKETFVFNKSSSEPLRPLAKGDFSVYLNHNWHSFSLFQKNHHLTPFRILMFPNSLIFFWNHF